MRAVVITKPGGPEMLGVAEREARKAGPGEVRIAVKAAAVNPTDIGLREHGAGDELEPPWVPGMDAAGTIESVGDGVNRLDVGDRSWPRSARVGSKVAPRRSLSSCRQPRWCRFPLAPLSPRPQRCR